MVLKIFAPAKINLGLEIGNKNANGYHEVDMIMQSISLCDEIYIEFSHSQKIDVEIDKKINCPREKNIAFRAAEAFFDYTKIKNVGVNIKIIKKIPMCAGLAGGSADGAGVIVGLNNIFESNLEISEMCEIGARVGSDVPFCIVGGAAAAKGTGTDIIPINTVPCCNILVIKPNISVSTAEAYSRFDEMKVTEKHSMSLLEAALKLQDLSGICANLYNRFEGVINNPKIFEIKDKLKSLGALGSLMTGSGSAVYGIFDDANKAETALQALQRKYEFTGIFKPLNHGAFVK